LDPSGGLQLAQLVNLVERVAGNLKLCPAEPDTALRTDFERSASVGGGSSRSTEVHGIVDQHARGLTGGVFENSAAEAVGRPLGSGVFRSIPARLSAR
jgi:hypothetical protein